MKKDHLKGFNWNAIGIVLMMIWVIGIMANIAQIKDEVKNTEARQQQIEATLQQAPEDINIETVCTEIMNQELFRYLDRATIPGDAKEWQQEGVVGYDYSIGGTHYRVILAEVPVNELPKYGPFIYLGDELELERIENQQNEGKGQ